MTSTTSFLSVPVPVPTTRIRKADHHHQYQFSAPKHRLSHSSNTWSSNPRISLTKSFSSNFILSSSSSSTSTSTSTSLADDEEEEGAAAAAAQSESSPTLSSSLRCTPRIVYPTFSNYHSILNNSVSVFNNSLF